MSEWSTVHSAPVEYLEGRCSEFPQKCWSRSLRCCRNPHLLHTWSSSYLEHSRLSSARRLLMQLFFGDDSSRVVWSHRPPLMSNVFLHGPLCLDREASRVCVMYPKIVCLFVCFLHYMKPFQSMFQPFAWCRGQQQPQFQPPVAATVSQIRTMWS